MVAPISSSTQPIPNILNATFRLQNNIGDTQPVPLGTNPDIPKNVYVANGFNNEIQLKGEINGINLTGYNPIPSHRGKDIGILQPDKFLRLEVTFSDSDKNLPYRFTICSKGHQPQIVCSDRGYTHVEISERKISPEDINISIEPDYP
jgi:hypothetical protein